MDIGGPVIVDRRWIRDRALCCEVVVRLVIPMGKSVETSFSTGRDVWTYTLERRGRDWLAEIQGIA